MTVVLQYTRSMIPIVHPKCVFFTIIASTNSDDTNRPFRVAAVHDSDMGCFFTYYWMAYILLYN